LEIGVTFVPLAAVWTAMWALMHVSYWLTLALALPAAGFLVRLFMIQHDCGHGAFFRNRAANDWVGRALGVLTFTPYDYWKRTHAAHHAGAGNLARRGLGDIETLTVAEYLRLDCRGRVTYRIYRHPLVMFGVGPSYLLLRQHRTPLGLMRGAGWTPWISTTSTNVGIATVVALLIWLVGPGPFLMIHGPIFLIAATIGVWLFYVQHQFEDTRWAQEVNWNHPQAALHGSSHYDLPIVSCAGSAPTSACIMSIISQAAFPSTVCRRSCATIPSLPASGGLRFGRACAAGRRAARSCAAPRSARHDRWPQSGKRRR
jgi:acyl-lipid omega-6 desaturase (Delta-12 desaturase)